MLSLADIDIEGVPIKAAGRVHVNSFIYQVIPCTATDEVTVASLVAMFKEHISVPSSNLI